MKVKKYNAILFLIVALSILSSNTSCKKNGEINNSDLSISFQTKVDGNNYALNTTYRNADNIDIKFEAFQFYLCDITITNSKGEKRLVSEIELFKCDESGLAILDFEVPNGNYESIDFGIGVKKELNTSDPADFASDPNHPLNIAQNTYWGWAGMYRFIMSEGRYDADLNNEFEGVFAYHTGRELSYRNLNVPHSFKIDKKEKNALSFNIDIYQLLEKSGNEINVTTDPFYHGGTENEYITTQISDNMLTAISIVE